MPDKETHHAIEAIIETLINCAVNSSANTRGKHLSTNDQDALLRTQIEDSRDLLYALGGDASEVDIKTHPKGGLFACFCKLPNRNIQTTTINLQRRWLFQAEDKSFALIPHKSTEWVTELLFSQNAVAPSFAPTFVDGTRFLASEGRQRMTANLRDLREQCTGDFKKLADYYKEFACSWRDGPRHSCPARLYVVGCSRDLISGQEHVQLHCVYTEGCQHHLDDRGRGRARIHTLHLGGPGMTPNGVCRDVVRRTDPQALWAGNKSFGPVNTAAARKALSRKRLQDYSKGEDDVTSIKIAQEELSVQDYRKDKFERNSFYGYIHEVLTNNTGDLRSVSIYCDLGISTFAKLIEENPNTSAIIDCTGGLVRDVWLSKASDMAMRSRKGTSKKPKAASKDGMRVSYDVLNFHLALKLPSCLFVPIEAVIVERNAYTFIDILTGLKRRLRQASTSGKGEHIRYFVCDMSPPFTIAVVYVFNQGMSPPEYLATRIFALKCGKVPNIRNTIVWCSVHAERAMRNFARDKFKTRDQNLVTDMEWLFRNFHLALCRTKSYQELCEVIGFIDILLSSRFFPAVGEHQASKCMTMKSTSDLVDSGESLLWKALNGVPSECSYDALAKVQVRSVQKKGYNPTHFEDAYNLKPLNASTGNENRNEMNGADSDEKLKDDSDTVSPVTGESKTVTLEKEPEASEPVSSEAFNDIESGRTGVFKLLYGNYDVYVSFRQLGNTPDRARYRIYIPSLTGRKGYIGGFSVWIKAFPGEGNIFNESYIDGAAREYIRKNWFPHLALLCPVLTGPVPVLHNTTVELSFRSKKHHENIGLLARQRHGGMRVAEYVKLAAQEAPVEAKRIRVLMETLRREALNPQPHRKRKGSEGFDEEKPKKKRKTFLDDAKDVNTLKANKALDHRIFEPKKPLYEEKERDEAGKGEGASSIQQSQSTACQIEEGWAKKQKSKRARDETDILELMRRKRKDYFGNWKQGEIASFLTTEYFLDQKMRIDRSAISRIFTEKQKPSAPGKDKCDILRDIFFNHLPKRTVDSERKLTGFKLLPICSQRIHELINNPTELQMEPNSITAEGDANVRLSDMQRLIRPENWSENESSYWISDEVVNAMTSLFALLDTKERVFFFNSLLVESALNAIDEAQFQRLFKGSDVTRKGQKWSFRESSKSFAPCHVNRNHWVGMRIDAKDHTVQCVNSLRSESSTNRYGKDFASVLQKIDGSPWKYLGEDESFPQQVNSMDCGILMLIGARNWALGITTIHEVSQMPNTTLWRERFAHELLVRRAS